MNEGFETIKTTPEVEQATPASVENVGVWTKVKNFLFQEIRVELTPKQQKVEDEINEFLHQEITWKKVHDFLFKEIYFGKKKLVSDKQAE